MYSEIWAVKFKILQMKAVILAEQSNLLKQWKSIDELTMENKVEAFSDCWWRGLVSSFNEAFELPRKF
jgi:hypothetical protein